MPAGRSLQQGDGQPMTGTAGQQYTLSVLKNKADVL
jgi:hypothetical protein